MHDPTTLQPGAPPPKDTPVTAFGAGSPADDPMRNFGYTVSAYSVLWLILLGFWFLSWRRQAALDGRVRALEAALARAGREGAGEKKGLAVPSVAHVIFIPGALLVGSVIGYILGVKAGRAEEKRRQERRRR
jgi:hypothetical protein